MEIHKSELEDGIFKLDIGKELEDKKITGQVELDIENQSYFVDVVNTIFDDPNVRLIVDLVNVTYIDSSGLWALFEGHKKASQKNGKMAIINITKDVRRVLDITKMSSKLDLFDSEADAVAHLKS